jgi:hypothetical protein
MINYNQETINEFQAQLSNTTHFLSDLSRMLRTLQHREQGVNHNSTAKIKTDIDNCLLTLHSISMINKQLDKGNATLDNDFITLNKVDLK